MVTFHHGDQSLVTQLDILASPGDSQGLIWPGSHGDNKDTNTHVHLHQHSKLYSKVRSTGEWKGNTHTHTHVHTHTNTHLPTYLTQQCQGQENIIWQQINNASPMWLCNLLMVQQVMSTHISSRGLLVLTWTPSNIQDLYSHDRRGLNKHCSYYHGYLIIHSLQLIHRNTLFSTITHDQVVAATW
jgi:hypothetical protein